MFQNNDYIKTILLRDGPLEKLWGGAGNFRAAGIFFLKAFQIFRLLSSVPTNGKREHRLKLEKVSNFFKFFKVARSYLYACYLCF